MRRNTICCTASSSSIVLLRLSRCLAMYSSTFSIQSHRSQMAPTRCTEDFRDWRCFRRAEDGGREGHYMQQAVKTGIGGGEVVGSYVSSATRWWDWVNARLRRFRKVVPFGISNLGAPKYWEGMRSFAVVDAVWFWFVMPLQWNSRWAGPILYSLAKSKAKSGDGRVIYWGFQRLWETGEWELMSDSSGKKFSRQIAWCEGDGVNSAPHFPTIQSGEIKSHWDYLTNLGSSRPR